MSDPTRGITCPDMRRVVREALSGGWRWIGMTGTNHCQIEWPKTGSVVTFGATPSLASWKTVATEIRRTSGVQVWRKGSKKRSRKSFAVADDPEVQASRRRHDRDWAERLAAIEAERQRQRAREQSARAAASSDRRRREIEDLMR